MSNVRNILKLHIYQISTFRKFNAGLVSIAFVNVNNIHKFSTRLQPEPRIMQVPSLKC